MMQHCSYVDNGTTYYYPMIDNTTIRMINIICNVIENNMFQLMNVNQFQEIDHGLIRTENKMKNNEQNEEKIDQEVKVNELESTTKKGNVTQKDTNEEKRIEENKNDWIEVSKNIERRKRRIKNQETDENKKYVNNDNTYEILREDEVELEENKETRMNNEKLVIREKERIAYEYDKSKTENESKKCKNAMDTKKNEKYNDDEVLQKCIVENTIWEEMIIKCREEIEEKNDELSEIEKEMEEFYKKQEKINQTLKENINNNRDKEEKIKKMSNEINDIKKKYLDSLNAIQRLNYEKEKISQENEVLEINKCDTDKMKKEYEIKIQNMKNDTKRKKEEMDDKIKKLSKEKSIECEKLNNEKEKSEKSIIEKQKELQENRKKNSILEYEINKIKNLYKNSIDQIKQLKADLHKAYINEGENLNEINYLIEEKQDYVEMYEKANQEVKAKNDELKRLRKCIREKEKDREQIV